MHVCKNSQYIPVHTNTVIFSSVIQQCYRLRLRRSVLSGEDAGRVGVFEPGPLNSTATIMVLQDMKLTVLLLADPKCTKIYTSQR